MFFFYVTLVFIIPKLYLGHQVRERAICRGRRVQVRERAIFARAQSPFRSSVRERAEARERSPCAPIG